MTPADPVLRHAAPATLRRSRTQGSRAAPRPRRLAMTVAPYLSFRIGAPCPAATFTHGSLHQHGITP